MHSVDLHTQSLATQLSVLLHMAQKHLRLSIQMCTIIVSQSVFGFIIFTCHPEELQIEGVISHFKPEHKTLLAAFRIDSYCKAD